MDDSAAHRPAHDQHGHHRDRGVRAMAHYLRLLPRMWSNEANDYAIAQLEPGPGDRVVDLGAGMGAGVMPAVARGAEVIAVDPTPFMRRMLGLRRLTSRRRGAITVVDGAAEAIPAPDGSADIVLAVNAVHHWQDLDRAGAEIGRVLGPGGRVLLVDEDFDHPDHERNAKPSRRRRRRHMHSVSALDMAAALESAGLIEVEAEETTITPDRPIGRATARKP